MLLDAYVTAGRTFYTRSNPFRSLNCESSKRPGWRTWLAGLFRRRIVEPPATPVWQRSARSRRAAHRPHPEAGEGAPDVADSMSKLALGRKADLTRELTLSTITLGVAATSTLFFPPAQILCLPLLVYLGATSAQNAWRAERRLNLALAETTVLGLCLIERAYFAGALSYSFYVFVRMWRLDNSATLPLPSVTWQPPAWAWAEQAGVERLAPVPALQAGDLVVVHTGEMIPVAGVVTAGVAWVKQRPGLPNGQPNLAKLQKGSQVEALAIVQVGCLWLAAV